MWISEQSGFECALDSEYALAMALAAWRHAERAVYQFTDSTSQERVRSVDLASRAVKVAGDNTTLVVLGHALCCAHEGWTRRRPRERRAARYESQNAASRSRFRFDASDIIA